MALLLLVLIVIVTANENIYFGRTEEALVEWIKLSNNLLKVFIYPVPSTGVTIVDGLTRLNVKNYFRLEHLFIRHNQQLKSSFITSNHSDANAFIIQHHWFTGIYRHCGELLHSHLIPIVDNVLINFPYYNRSNGRDHFFFSVYDNGVYDNRSECWSESEQYITKLRQTLSRISNVSFIGNYGMDLENFGVKNPYKHQTRHSNDFLNNLTHSENLRFIPERDIVMPQMLTTAVFSKYLSLSAKPNLNRTFDSAFSGSAWWDRRPLVDMSANMQQDYFSNHTEMLATFFNRAADTSLISHAYFGYNPCGFACWSTRLYDCIASLNIPIIVGTGNIQAFEKFINWKKLSVKMSRETWFNVTARNEFRRLVRVEADTFRDIVDSRTDALRDAINATLAAEKEAAVWSSFIGSKMENLRRVFPWFYFDGNFFQSIPWKHPYRLLQLEIWCRVSSLDDRRRAFQDFIHQSNDSKSIFKRNYESLHGIRVNMKHHASNLHLFDDICSRPSDFTARMEYFYS